MRSALVWAAALGTAVLLVAAVAHAGGMFLGSRGVRPLGRGGAFVAGAEGSDALPHNPAGMTEGPADVLLDFGLPLHSTTYTRRLNAGSEPMTPVEGKGLGLPSPTLGAVHGLRLLPGLRFGIGLYADYPLVQNWPATDADGSPAPQRYAVLSYAGTAIMKLAAGAAYRLAPWASFGATMQLLLGSFVTRGAVSTCDGFVCTQPENPDYDAEIELSSGMLAIPGAQLGLLVDPADWLRLGLAFETGYDVDAVGTMRVRLPAAGAYDGSSVEPAEPPARLQMRLPMQVRAGAELRLVEPLRVEVACIWERWSVHDRIVVDAQDAFIRDVLAFGDYQLGRVTFERRLHSTVSARLGAEWWQPVAAESRVSIRGGLAYEPSATPDETLTVMAVDLTRVLLTLGAAYRIGADFEVELLYAYVAMARRTVTNSEAMQPNATRPQWQGRTVIGNGTYDSSAHVLGVGVRLLLPQGI